MKNTRQNTYVLGRYFTEYKYDAEYEGEYARKCLWNVQTANRAR